MTRFAFRGLIQLRENVFQTFNVRFGLLEMCFERVLQFLRGGRIRHLRQCLKQLILCIVQVAQFVDVKFL